MAIFTASQNLVLTLDSKDLSTYSTTVDLDLVNKILVIKAHDDTSSTIAKRFQSVCAGSVFQLTIMNYQRVIRHHDISNIDVLSLRFISDTETRLNDWELTLSFAECETVYPDAE